MSVAETIFGPASDLQFADWCSLHDTVRPGPQTEAFPGRGQGSGVRGAVWRASPLLNPVFATICDSIGALSIMVFSEQLGTIKFSSSSLVSLLPLHWVKLCPLRILHNSLKSQLKHQFFSFFFLVCFLNKAFLTTLPQSAPSNSPNSDCFFIWQIITYRPTSCLSFLVRKDSGFKMGALDLCSGSVPCWKWSPRTSAYSNENIF